MRGTLPVPRIRPLNSAAVRIISNAVLVQSHSRRGAAPMIMPSKLVGFLAGVVLLGGATTPSAQDDRLRRALDAMVAAYPDAFTGHDDAALHWRDGTIMPASDGTAKKTFSELLRRASIVDQFHVPYPRGPLPKPPAVDADPGRFRNAAFFSKMYGDCRKGEVSARLVSHRLASQELGPNDPRHRRERRRPALARHIFGTRRPARKNQTRRISDRRHLQLPGGRGHRPAERARLWDRDRSQSCLLRLLALGAGTTAPTSIATACPRKSSRSSKSTDLSGAASGSLRHHAFRIST